jgi:translation initiation factor 3 subunit F
MLLGITNGNNVIVTDCYGVHHERREKELHIRKGPVSDLSRLHKKVNKNESIVGWYSTTANGQIDDITYAIQIFFSDYAVKPIHLSIDVSLEKPHIGVQAYHVAANMLARDSLVFFQELKTSIKASTEERVAIDAMKKAAFGTLPIVSNSVSISGTSTSSSSSALIVPSEVGTLSSELESLNVSIRRLKSLVDTSLTYVREIIAGKRQADEATGRAILETLTAIPSLDAAGFEAAFTSSLQDLLMVTYLSNLTQAQLKLAERIATQVGSS